VPLDISQRAKGFQAIVRRFPNGPVAMIAPFNFPINLAVSSTKAQAWAGWAAAALLTRRRQVDRVSRTHLARRTKSRRPLRRAARSS